MSVLSRLAIGFAFVLATASLSIAETIPTNQFVQLETSEGVVIFKRWQAKDANGVAIETVAVEKTGLDGRPSVIALSPISMHWWIDCPDKIPSSCIIYDRANGNLLTIEEKSSGWTTIAPLSTSRVEADFPEYSGDYFGFAIERASAFQQLKLEANIAISAPIFFLGASFLAVMVWLPWFHFIPFFRRNRAELFTHQNAITILGLALSPAAFFLLISQFKTPIFLGLVLVSGLALSVILAVISRSNKAASLS
ncbi:hypothetical protein [Roseibium sediminis]|uniref:hypothetical protein n=1 Tax=Roseibium sediminis TaxID=1775174 RepID=UPI00123CEF8E|nr:hypothetical protein [Roseibium sediminis]